MKKCLVALPIVCLLLIGSVFGQTKTKSKSLTANVQPQTLTQTASVTLTCNASEYATGYNFYRYTSTTNACPATPSYTELGASPMETSCGYMDTAVVPGGTYAYVATAVNASGESTYSNQVCVSIPGNPTVASVSPASGSAGGGSAIVITGTNFQTGADVVIGGVTATSVVVVSSTEITAITPTGTVGAASLVITNPDNLSVTVTSGFTYTLPIPAPPTGLAVISIVASNVTLDWPVPEEPAGVSVVSYNLYRCHESFCPEPPLAATVTGTKYTDKCSYPKRCYYEIKANVSVLGKAELTAASNIVYAPI